MVCVKSAKPPKHNIHTALESSHHPRIASRINRDQGWAQSTM